MTIWAAKSVFQEKERGSLEVGKNADFIILSQNLMTVNERDILKTQVLQTFVDGKKVHQENEKKRTGIAIVLADDNEK